MKKELLDRDGNGRFVKLDIDEERIRNLYCEKGKKGTEIAKELGYKEGMVYWRIRQKGWKRKGGWEWKLDIAKEVIEDLYNNKRLSTHKIAKKLNTTSTSITRLMKQYDINSRSLSEAHKGKIMTEEHRRNIGKAGIGKRLIKVDLERIKNLYLIEKKSTPDIGKIMGLNQELVYKRLKNMGVKIRSHSESKKLKFRDKEWTNKFWKGFNVRPNKPEKILINLIKKNNLPFNYTGDGKIWFSSENSSFNPDFLSKNPKHIIELFGDYFHNRPESKIRDKERLKTYKSLGYKVLIIWEHELENLDNVLRRVQKFVNQ